MAVLMLCDKPVYDIASNMVLDNAFCPFINADDTKKAYERWRSNRIYLKINRTAERIVQQAGGRNTREAKRRLSLSDGYWVKHKFDTDVTFASITPYLNTFSEARAAGGRIPSSVPELVLGGSQPKLWMRGSDGVTYMRKSETPEQIRAEILAVKLIRKCGAKVMNAFIQTDKGKVYADHYSASRNTQNIGVINLVNMTNVNRSLIQFDQLGIWVDGYDPASVAGGYKQAGVLGDTMTIALLQVIFDAIVGNIDRRHNNSNWGIFMDNNTGKRDPSWMYDFNWANLSGSSLEQVVAVAVNIKKAGGKVEKVAATQAEHIKGVCAELGLTVWEDNARQLLEVFVS